MSAQPIATVKPEVPRDGWGRPKVIPPGGGKPVAYTRCTTYVGCLEDTFNLARWQQRMVALGLADRPDLALAVTSHREDKRKLNDLCQDAIEAAKGRAGATVGTAVHKLTEVVDRGEELPTVPGDTAKDLQAYQEAIAPLDIVSIEAFLVCDELKVGGTADRIVSYQGRNYIADLKTGSVEWGAGKIAMQLALYSRSLAYDPATGQRSPIDVDQDWGLVIHLPAGQGECQLYRVDLQAGWYAVGLATAVREWRSRKDLLVPAQIPSQMSSPSPDGGASNS